MSIRKYKAEQIVTLLRQIEVAMANGKTAPQACKEAGIHTPPKNHMVSASFIIFPIWFRAVLY
jgi:hypothetical protein